MRSYLPLLSSLLPALALTACDTRLECANVNCAPCPPAIFVRVRGTAGSPPPEATLVGLPSLCSPETDYTGCNSTQVSAPGHYTFEVQAPHYQSMPVEVDVGEPKPTTGCCSCSYDSRVVDVQLQPLEG